MATEVNGKRPTDFNGLPVKPKYCEKAEYYALLVYVYINNAVKQFLDCMLLSVILSKRFRGQLLPLEAYRAVHLKFHPSNIWRLLFPGEALIILVLFSIIWV